MARSTFSFLLGALLVATLGTGCSKTGSSVLVVVTATPTMADVPHVRLSVTVGTKTRVYDIENRPGPDLTTMKVGLQLPPGVRGTVAIVAEARRDGVTLASASGQATIDPDNSITLLLTIGGPMDSDLPAPDLLEADLAPSPDLETCGNGVVDPSESCDPASDMGACPTKLADCDDATTTTTDTFTGTGCQATCTHLTVPVGCVADPSGTGCPAGYVPQKCGPTLPSEVVEYSDEATWYSPEQALLLDSSAAMAYLAPNNFSSVLVVNDFGFSVPQTADSLDGITVELDVTSVSNALTTHSIGIFYYEGGFYDKNAAGPWTTANLTYGGPTDTWSGIGLSAINEPWFGVALVAFNASTSVQAGVDRVRVTVHYTVGGAKLSQTMVGKHAESRPFRRQWVGRDGIRNEDPLQQAQVYAMVSGEQTTTLLAIHQGFQIPSTATIRGVEVVVARSANSSNCLRDRTVQLYSAAGVPKTASKAVGTDWGVGPTTVLYGGPTDLWAATDLTPEMLNATSFGPGFSVDYSSVSGNCSPGVDYIKTTAYVCVP